MLVWKVGVKEGWEKKQDETVRQGREREMDGMMKGRRE